MGSYSLYLYSSNPEKAYDLIWELDTREDQIAMAIVLAEVHGREVMLPTCYESMFANVVTPTGEWLGPGGDPRLDCC